MREILVQRSKILPDSEKNQCILQFRVTYFETTGERQLGVGTNLCDAPFYVSNLDKSGSGEMLK